MILLVNGPNLNLLGEREPDVYGHETLADVERMVAETCAPYGVEVKAFQSNWEGALIDFLQEHRREAQGVILNPGALTHTSRALPDCLRALPCPTIEVHISNIHAREAWRHESFVAPAARGQIVGLGVAGYCYAALHLCYQLGVLSEVQEPGREAATAELPATPPFTAPPGSGSKSPASEEPDRPWLDEASLGKDGQSTAELKRLPAETLGGSALPPQLVDLGVGDQLPEPLNRPVGELPLGEYEPL